MGFVVLPMGREAAWWQLELFAASVGSEEHSARLAWRLTLVPFPCMSHMLHHAPIVTITWYANACSLWKASDSGPTLLQSGGYTHKLALEAFLGSLRQA